MLNIEKYKDEIYPNLYNMVLSSNIAVKDGVFVNCDMTDCKECDFFNPQDKFDCPIDAIIEWLLSEHEE